MTCLAGARVLQGRRAVVTGAASGIGAAIAWAYAQQGADVCLVDRKGGDALQLVADGCRESGGTVAVVTADVSVEADVDRLFREAREQLRGVDVLVNNAGILTNNLVTDMSAAVFDEMIAVNLRSVFLCCREVLPGMLEDGFGRIINISSQLALKGGPTLAHYAAAKAGVLGFTKSLAREVGGTGVTVNCIAPGPVDTLLAGELPPGQAEATRLSLPLQRIGLPGEVAPTAVLLASDPGGNLYTGQTLSPNSGDVMP